MSRLTDANVALAREMIARYPRPKSALIPLLHLAQEQEGWVSDDAMAHLAELVGVTAAEVRGTCTFYEMFKLHPVGTYMVNVCTNISCQLLGGEELLHHAEEALGIRPGGTTEDGLFTLEDVECIAACTEAPCMQVNYRYGLRLSTDDFDQIIADLRAGRHPRGLVTANPGEPIPSHGTLGLTRQQTDESKMAGVLPPEQVNEAPVWLNANATEDAS
ncbi:MAG: NAD(P)H-dependent oxidoreductase subunit E [Acidimicrobiales bacterium]|nr:NAD(P)H-dependent oxidoreductase subunit E [Acidimicrobiales bacterium]